MQRMETWGIGSIAGVIVGALVGVPFGDRWVVVGVFLGAALGLAVGSSFGESEAYAGPRFLPALQLFAVLGVGVAVYFLAIDPWLVIQAPAEVPTMEITESAPPADPAPDDERGWALPVWIVGVALSWLGYRLLSGSDAIPAGSMSSEAVERRAEPVEERDAD